MTHRVTVWGVFEHPPEYLDGWVARQFVVLPGEYQRTEHVIQAATLDDLHRIPAEMGLGRTHRFTEDNATLKEAWQ
jgi:hypothetical protein